MSKKTYLVAGCGVSGLAAAELLYEMGESPVLYDGNENLELEAIRSKLQPGMDIPCVFGELTDELLRQTDICVISPGIPLQVPFVEKLKEAGIPIWSEIELAYRFGKGKIAAITGTNGKTTTTALTGALFKEYFDQVSIVGNIGIPYTSEAKKLREDSVIAAEISSFQLESILTFHPVVSAILNITPDHLNRHGTMEEYIRVKESITKNQTKEDWCVLNYEDPVLRKFGETACPCQTVFFSSERRIRGGIYLEGDTIFSELDGDKEEVLHTGELQILGKHNYENAMAAIAICRKMGVPMEWIQKGCRAFQAVEHRIEFVKQVEGVDYYNDSKGTNPDAAIQAVRAMTRPTVLIGGGYDKGSEYEEWIGEFPGRVKKLILIGQTAEKIAECARKMGFSEISFAGDMAEAVSLAKESAVAGDAVLLSPACASWGMFKNYEERGRIFKDLVRSL